MIIAYLPKESYLLIAAESTISSGRVVEQVLTEEPYQDPASRRVENRLRRTGYPANFQARATQSMLDGDVAETISSAARNQLSA